MEPETLGPPVTNSIIVSESARQRKWHPLLQVASSNHYVCTTQSYPGIPHFSLLQIKGNQREIVSLVYFSSQRSLLCEAAGLAK